MSDTNTNATDATDHEGDLAPADVRGMPPAVVLLMLLVLLGGVIGAAYWLYSSNDGGDRPPLLPGADDDTRADESEPIAVPDDVEIDDDALPRVRMRTSSGDIVLELYEDDAPIAVNNFVALCLEGFYDSTRFHRIVQNFMIQGGCPLSADRTQSDKWGTGGPGYGFAHEPTQQTFAHGPYTLAYANSGPNSNGSQFFITTTLGRSVTGLDDGFYTIFGTVVEGEDVVDLIAATPVGPSRSGEQSDPLEDVFLRGTEVLRVRAHGYRKAG